MARYLVRRGPDILGMVTAANIREAAAKADTAFPPPPAPPAPLPSKVESPLGNLVEEER